MGFKGQLVPEDWVKGVVSFLIHCQGKRGTGVGVWKRLFKRAKNNRYSGNLCRGSSVQRRMAMERLQSVPTI